MTIWRTGVAIGLFISLASGCANPAPRPLALADAPAATEPPIDWKSTIAEPLGVIGVAHPTDPVYTVTVPRTDVMLTVDGMSVPTSAGVASTFHFYRCPCGKINVLGDFVCADYESNDVIDALRPHNLIRIAGVSPIAVGAKPNLVSVRFQGEGEPKELAALIKEAMRWTGEARMKPVR